MKIIRPIPINIEPFQLVINIQDQLQLQMTSKVGWRAFNASTTGIMSLNFSRSEFDNVSLTVAL